MCVVQVQEPATSGSVFKRVSNIRFEIKGAHTANFDSPTDLWWVTMPPRSSGCKAT